MELAYLLEPSFQIVDKSGNPLSNGYIEVYIAGTSTKYYCYSDFGGSLHPFRIPLDALGSNIILANTGLIYDVFIYNQFGTMVMSRHRVTPMIPSTTTTDHTYIIVEGTEGQITVESSGSTDIIYKVGLDDAIINELSGIHSDISSTSSYFENKINNLDIHNIAIEQFGTGNAFTSFTKNGDTYTFKKEETFLPSDKAPIVLAGENVEVTAANTDGRTIYTIKANPAGNVTNLISTDDTVSISSTSVGNDVTYDLSVKDIAGENGAKNYAFLKSEMPVNATEMALEITDRETNGITWNTIDQRLEFDEHIKLIDLNFNVAYEINDATGVSYEDLILYILSDGQLLEQQTYSIDTSKAKFVCIWNKKILDPSNLQFSIKVPKAGTVDASIDVNDETFKSIGSSVSGSTYYAGSNINIIDNIIIGRDWTPELNDKLDTTAFDLPNSANWDNIYNTVNSSSANWDKAYNTVLANSATWNEGGGSTDIELYSSDGSLLISADGSAYDLKLNEQLSAKNYFVTNNENNYSPDSPAGSGGDMSAGTIWFGTNKPKTDLSAMTYDDDGGKFMTSQINIPKEMKLFDVKLTFSPSHHYDAGPTYGAHGFRLYLDNTVLEQFNIMVDNMYGTVDIERNFLIYNPMSADSILWLQCTDGLWGGLTPTWFGWVKIDINDETYRSIGTSGYGIPDNYDSLYSTVSSNSATWNEGGGSTYSAGPNINITNDTISGRDWTPELNQFKFDVEVSNTAEFMASLINPDVHFINVITDTCQLNTMSSGSIQGDKYIYGKKIFFKFGYLHLNDYKLYFLNDACENTTDTQWQGDFYYTSSDAGVYIKNLYGGAQIDHIHIYGTFVYQTGPGSVTTNFTQSNWVTPELENYDRIKYNTVKLNNVYDTVSSNSAAWSNDTTYTAGSNIDITNDVISGKDWSNEINSKLDTSAFDLPNSANWDTTYNTVSSNSATWNNNSQIINHNPVASDTLVVDNNEYINVSGLDVSGVLTVKAMNTSVTNGEPITQCGGTLKFTTSPSAINFVDSTDTALPKLDGVPTAFSGNVYQFTIINGVVACQEIK